MPMTVFTAGVDYDQLSVNGGVDLNADSGAGGILDPICRFVPNPGDSFLVLDNDGTDAIEGEFAGLPEGAIFDAVCDTEIVPFQITYIGGDGNDVVLTVVGPPPAAVSLARSLYEPKLADWLILVR